MLFAFAGLINYFILIKAECLLKWGKLFFHNPKWLNEM